jgi:hypothetical protein
MRSWLLWREECQSGQQVKNYSITSSASARMAAGNESSFPESVGRKSGGGRSRANTPLKNLRGGYQPDF